jgi:hypothetical protein
MSTSANDIIKNLNLQPHPEGGYFRETFRSSGIIPASGLPPEYNSQRNLSTAIYYMLTPDSASMMHRLVSDEVYHFYLGDPVTMLLLYPGGQSETVTLGHDIAAGQLVQGVVPAGVWQGSFLQSGGQYALLGCTVAPGFDFEDFELGDRQKLMADYQDRAELITRLTAGE